MTGYWAPPTVRQRLDRCGCGARAGRPPERARVLRVPHPRPGPRWAHVDLEPRHARRRAARTDAVGGRGRLALPGCRLVGPARGGAGRRDARAGACARLAADREAYLEASRVDGGDWSGPGVHPGRVVGGAAAAAAGQRDPDHGCRQLRGLGGARLPLPAAGHVPGPHERARWATACRRPSRRRMLHPGPPGRRARRRRRLRDDHGRAGDVRARGRPTRSPSCFDNGHYGTIRMHQEREGRADHGVRPGPDRLRSGGPGQRRAGLHGHR